MAAVVGLAVGASCVQSNSTACGSGRVCPPDRVCDEVHDGCVLPAQLTACNGATEGDACEISAPGDGTCHDGVCLLPDCGNGIREGAEDCDGTDLGMAADGRLIDCTDYGYHEPQPLSCRSDCLLDLTVCAGTRCGDDLVNGPEICDGAPPTESCVAFGYDRGVLGCTTACAPDFSGCDTMGWQLSSFPDAFIIKGIWGTAPDNLYALAGTDMYRFDGTEWTVAHQGGTVKNAIWGRSATELYVAGSGERIYRWDGTALQPMTAGGGTIWNGLWGPPTGSVFAVGEGGQIRRFDGTNWLTESSGTASELYAVAGTSDSDVFAVGAQGVIVHRGATGTWAPMTSNVPTTVRLSGVVALAPNNVFAAGGNQSAGGEGTIIHYDGITWTAMPLPTTEALTAIWGADGHAVAVARDNGVILWFDGVRWLQMASPLETELQSVFGISSENVYAGSIERLLHWRGTPFWSPQQVPTIAGLSLEDVWAADGGLAVAVGSSSSFGKILRTDGFRWTDVSPSTMPAFYGVSGTSASELYAVGNGVIRRSTDGAAATWGGDLTASFIALGVAGVAGGPIVAAGYVTNTAVLRRRVAASNWQTETVPALARFNDIVATSATDFWVATSVAKVLHYTGSTWDQVVLPDGPTSVASVWASSPSDVYAAGAAGRIAHFNGTSWSTQQVGGPDVFNEIDGDSSDHVLACGANGKLWRWNGTSWSVFNAQTAATFRSVAVLPDRTFVVGDDGSIRLLVEP